MLFQIRVNDSNVIRLHAAQVWTGQSERTAVLLQLINSLQPHINE
jgi:hypothetical protein